MSTNSRTTTPQSLPPDAGSTKDTDATSLHTPSSMIGLPTVALIECPACASENAPSRKFCRACGHALREPCVECNAETLTGETFCGECGVDLKRALQQRTEKVEADLAEARRLCNEAQFDEAQSLVRPWTKIENAALAGHASRAGALLSDIAQSAQQSDARIAEAVGRAERAGDNCQWRDVIALIESVPSRLRSDEDQQRLTQANAALAELTLLTEEIRTAIRKKKLIGLLPSVERALELAPADERLEKLAEQLRRRTEHDARKLARERLSQAREKVATFAYAEAFQLLEDVPEECRDAAFQKQHAHARELSYLWGAVRHTPVVDANLLAIGERLAEHSPGDGKVAAVLEQLRQRAQKRKSRPLDTIAWARQPQEPALGCRVQPLTSFGVIDIEPVASAPRFAENASRLYVACGLALQGVRKAAVATNFLPRAKGRMVGQVSNWFKSAPSGLAAWGIDLSSSGLKAVRFVRRPNDDGVQLQAFDVIDHATPLGALVNESQRRDMQADTLQRFLARNTIGSEAVCIGFPGEQTLGRFFSVPPTDGKQLDELMQYEARQQVPIPLNQLAWDYHVWQPTEEDRQRTHDAMLLAVKQFHINHRLQLLEDAGLRPHVLQSDVLALYNFYRHALASQGGELSKVPQEVDRKVTVLLDVGADSTSFVAGTADGLWFRSLPWGGNDFSKALVRAAKLNFAKAEQLKINPAQARRFSDLHKAWQPLLEQIFRDVSDSIDAYANVNRHNSIERIWTCGGGWRVHGLHRHLVE